MPVETFSSGIADPQATPERAPGSVRRTSSVDISFPSDGMIHLAGRCRDLFTAMDRGSTPLCEARLDAVMDGQHVLQSIAAQAYSAADRLDGPQALHELVGTTVRAGFRARLQAVLASGPIASPLAMLLDELPVAALISGYARMYRNEPGLSPSNSAALQSDICAGWRSDGLMIRSIRNTGRMPVPLGPPAPAAETTDSAAWHHLADLPTGAMRRRRLIDITPTAGGTWSVFATFRDAHVGDDSVSRVLHEYTLDAVVDSEGRLADVVAVPRVLPWHECPEAAASASRLNGQHPDEIRASMRGVTGLGTCTHLNDLLRSLGDVAALIAHVDSARPR